MSDADITTYSIIPFVIFGIMSFCLWLWFAMIDLLKGAIARPVTWVSENRGTAEPSGRYSK